MTTSLAPITVLIIEDDEEDYMLTREYLTDHPGSRFSIEWATSLKNGVDTLSKNAVDVVLLDMSLPDAQGLDGFKQLRAQFPQLPIIILTGFSDEDIGTEAVRQGAQDYILKQNLDTALLDHALRYAIERKKTSDQLQQYADQLRRQNNEITENLRLARKVQQRLLPQTTPGFPRSLPPSQRTLRFSHLYHPSTIMSGDFFDILTVSDTKAGAFICDVMGHGMRAALITAIVRGLVEELRHFADNPGRFLTEMNRSLTSILQSPGELIFVTALHILVDADTGMARYATAGHPAPVQGSKKEGTVNILNSGDTSYSPALGMFANETYKNMECQLQAGDLLFCFTDGIYEVLGRDEEEYGNRRLIECLRNHMDQPLNIILQQLIADVGNFSGAGEQGLSDDICLLGLSYRGQGEA